MEFKWPTPGTGLAGFRWPSNGSTPPPPFTDALSTLFSNVAHHGTAGTVLNSYFDNTTTFSISVWIKFTSTASLTTIIANDSNAGNRGVFLAWDSAGGGRWDLQLGNSYPASYLWVTFNHTPVAGTWYHILLTYDGSSSANGVKLFLDGVSLTKVNQLNTLSTSSVSATTLYVASYAPDTYPWAGNIDELAIFNADKSSSASTIYNGGTPTNLQAVSGLVEWWRMGDGDTFPTLTGQEGLQNVTLINMTAGSLVADAP